MILMIMLAGIVVMSLSLVGVFFVGRKAEDWLGERLSYLVAFSAGVFLVTGGALAFEVFHIFEGALVYGIFVIVIGYAVAALLELVFPETHHHHDPHDHDHRHGSGSARKILIADAIHNVGDGMILVPAFLVSPALGLAVTVSIIVHETLQEISEFFVLKQAGYTTKRALIANFAVSSTIFVGIALSYLALATHELEGTLLALSAGFFLHVVVHDLLPKRHHHESSKTFLLHIVFVIIGLVLMAFLGQILGDAHGQASEAEASEHTS